MTLPPHAVPPLFGGGKAGSGRFMSGGRMGGKGLPRSSPSMPSHSLMGSSHMGKSYGIAGHHPMSGSQLHHWEPMHFASPPQHRHHPMHGPHGHHHLQHHPVLPDMNAKPATGLAHLSLHPDGATSARIDFWALLVGIVLPAIVFAAVTAALSFRLRYDAAAVAWLLVLLCLIPAGIFGYYAWRSWASRGLWSRWELFLCFACVAAVLAGIVVGDFNYFYNTEPYYSLLGLDYEPDVNPSLSGVAHMDTGRFLFTNGSKLDLSRAMSLRMRDVYCVAPVIWDSPKVGANPSYDYWAVGMNCCSPTQPQADFNCGEARSVAASAGMRLMDDGSRPWYRMAVQEAEAAYDIAAAHPIFLHWVQDPLAEANGRSERGMRLLIESFFSFLAAMAFVTVVALLCLSRHAMDSHHCHYGFHKFADANPPESWQPEETTEHNIHV